MIHGIGKLKIKLSADAAAVQKFKEKYVNKALENCYIRDDIYNRYETGLN